MIILIIALYLSLAWNGILTYIMLNHLRNHRIFRQTYAAWQKSKE